MRENFDIHDPDGSVRIAGVAGSLTATDGQVLTADGNGETTWETPAGPAFNGWTSDGADPANINANGGSIEVENVVADSIVSAPGVVTSPQTSGALTTVTFSSGTGLHLTAWDSDVSLYVPWTTDGTNNVATLKVELSPDNTTYSTLATLSVAAGHSASLAVTAHNPSDGIVNLPHPLSCAPRLDHSEMCPEMVQQIPSGQSASAQYSINATGIAPGTYSLSIEGVLTVRVTVS